MSIVDVHYFHGLSERNGGKRTLAILTPSEPPDEHMGVAWPFDMNRIVGGQPDGTALRQHFAHAKWETLIVQRKAKRARNGGPTLGESGPESLGLHFACTGQTLMRFNRCPAITKCHSSHLVSNTQTGSHGHFGRGVRTNMVTCRAK
jgi:hypothetical protein